MILEIRKGTLIKLMEQVVPYNEETCEQMEREGKMVFVGNQHNPDWDWDEEYLRDLNEDELKEIINDIEEREKTGMLLNKVEKLENDEQEMIATAFKNAMAAIVKKLETGE